jgi:AcrR family transcriptional regulator
MTTDKAPVLTGPTEGRIGRPRRTVTDRLDETLLDLAAEALRRSDFAEMSLERLAARIGVSKPTIYRRFANRNALLEAVVERQLARLSDGDAPEQADPTDPVGRLRVYARQLFLVLLRPDTANFFQFLVQEGSANPRLADLHHAWHRRVLTDLDRLLQPCGTAERGRSANLLVDLLYTPITLRLMRFDDVLSGMTPEDFFAWRFAMFEDAVLSSIGTGEGARGAVHGEISIE